jgi:hypothetical protein
LIGKRHQTFNNLGLKKQRKAFLSVVGVAIGSSSGGKGEIFLSFLFFMQPFLGNNVYRVRRVDGGGEKAY